MCLFISGVGVRAGGNVLPVPPYVAGPVRHYLERYRMKPFLETSIKHHQVRSLESSELFLNHRTPPKDAA